VNSWTWTAFAITIASEVVLLAAVVVSILRPERRIWPPPGKSTWQFHVTFWPVIIGVAAGIALAWLDWNSFVWTADERILVGGVLVALGLGIADWGVRALGRPTSSGLGGPFHESGPYRYSRNPQYVGDILAVIGIAIVANSRLLWIAAAPAILGLALGPFAEEGWLRRTYGEGYEAYARRIPRFVGIPRSSRDHRRP
jgi:protein-S-isoprenylcysteine O-methyltransferase Ste14